MGKREYDELISIMQNNRFWVYGYGKVAKRLYRQVVRRGFVDNLLGFIVTDLLSVNEHFCEKPIVSIDRVDKNDWVLIAADVTSTEGITRTLIEHDFSRYYKVFFSMIDLECGMPSVLGKSFPTELFFADNSSSNWVAAIYLAATRYMSKGLSGKDIYIHFLSWGLNNETAKKDYDRFMKTVELCEKNGFIQDYPIKLCKDLYLLDGAHRIVLSHCFGDGKVLADIYGVSRCEWEQIILKKTLRLDDDEVVLKYLTEAELKVLKSVPSMINSDVPKTK